MLLFYLRNPSLSPGYNSFPKTFPKDFQFLSCIYLFQLIEFDIFDIMTTVSFVSLWETESSSLQIVIITGSLLICLICQMCHVDSVQHVKICLWNLLTIPKSIYIVAVYVSIHIFLPLMCRLAIK